MDLKQGDVVLIPYPYIGSKLGTRRASDPCSLPPNQVRPAVIISGRKLRDEYEQLFIAMVTRADQTTEPADVVIQDYAAVGLNTESRVRTSKLACLPADAVVRRLGNLSTVETEVVMARVRQFLVR